MKKALRIFVIMLSLFMAVGLTACSDEGTTQPNNGETTTQTQTQAKLVDITGVTYSDQTIAYDGKEHVLTVTGTLPSGVSVAYSTNKGTDVGTYNAVATLTGEGYNQLVLNAKLVITGLTLDVTGLSFEDDTFTYDGTKKKIELTGTLPEDATVSYTSNEGTDAGTYNAKAIISKKGYNNYTFSAALTIEKAELTGVTFAAPEEKLIFTGETLGIEVKGTLPADAEIDYTNASAIAIGSYNATAVITSKNYNTKTLTCTWKISPDLAGMGQALVDNILNIPDPWEYMPEAFLLENMTYELSQSLDFTAGVSKGNFSTGMGDQLNMVYDTLLNAKTALTCVNEFTNIASSFVSVYQTYINANEDDYASFETEGAEYAAKITLDGNDILLLLSYKGANIELTYEQETNKCGGRIELSDSNVLKYEFDNSSMSLAYSLAGISLTKIDLEDTGEGFIYGEICEYLGTSSVNTESCATIYIDDNYLMVSGNKGDFITGTTGSLVELYNARTAEFIGSEVKESISSIDYDTLWFALDDISAITSIKVIYDEKSNTNTAGNGNPDTIYINGSTNNFVAKYNSKLGVKTSRQFDIEMKTMHYVVYNSEEEKYEHISFEIPMLFVQRANLETYEADIYEENSENGITTAVVHDFSTTQINNLEIGYTTYIPLYETLKEDMTYDLIVGFIAEKNPYFE